MDSGQKQKNLLLAKERILLIKYIHHEKRNLFPFFNPTPYKRLFDKELISDTNFRQKLYQSIEIKFLNTLVSDYIDFQSEQTMKEIILSKPDIRISHDLYSFYRQNPKFKQLVKKLAPNGLGSRPF